MLNLFYFIITYVFKEKYIKQTHDTNKLFFSGHTVSKILIDFAIKKLFFTFVNVKICNIFIEIFFYASKIDYI